MHKSVAEFDHVVARIVKLMPESARPIMEFCTLIGQPVVVLVLGIIIGTSGLVRAGSKLTMVVLGGYIAFGINTLVKYFVHRARPETMYARGMLIKSYSFPSGHAFGTMFFYGFLAYLAASRLPQPWAVIIASFLAVLILLVGVSRVYLGAHFPSDVFVGWLWGGVSLVVILNIVKL